MATGVAERAWSLVVPHHPRGARAARHRLVTVLTGLVQPDRLADAVTVLAELVANAVRHGAPLPGNVVRVGWRLFDGGSLEVSVTDGGSIGPPAPRTAGPDAVDGRGLTIVGALATRWGVVRDGQCQCVWAVLI
jgi:anti-sigma regulatory factor (Ser/Thr protein kinase)